MVKRFIRIDTTIDNSWNVINNVEIKSNGEILISEVEIDLKQNLYHFANRSR